MMRPEEIAVAMLRRWWLILLAAIAAAGVAYVVTSAQEKTYVVSVRVMAIAEPPEYWLDLYAKNRLASYQNLINTWDFVNEALQHSGADIDPGLAQQKLALGRNPDANIVQIVVTDNDPVRAATIANALGDFFVVWNESENERVLAQQTTLTNPFPGRVNAHKLESPSPPDVASGPRVRVNTVAGGVLGIVVGIVLAFGLVYYDDTLKTRRDIQRYLEWPVLGAIPASDD